MVVRRNRRRAAPLVCSHVVAETRTRAGLSIRGRHSFVTPCVGKAKSPTRVRRSRRRLRAPGQLINQSATFEACRTVKAGHDQRGRHLSFSPAAGRSPGPGRPPCSSLLTARCRGDGVALAMLVPETEQDWPPRSPPSARPATTRGAARLRSRLRPRRNC